MGKRNLQFIVYSLSLITVPFASANVPLDTFQSAGYFDTAVIQSGLRNTEDTDAFYIAPLNLDTGGVILKIDVNLELSPSNSVTLAFGTPQEPDILRIINEDGRWTILMGGEKRPFDTPLPTPLTGTHIYRLILTMDMTAGLYTSTVKVYEDGILIPLPNSQFLIPNSPIPPSAWAGQDPSAWTQVAVNLRGKAILKSLRCSLDPAGSIILIR